MSLIYLDCNATTPIEPEVIELINFYNSVEFANAGSRTHEMGTIAKQAVERARIQIASLLECERDEVIFTSGATESNNLAILGLEQFALSSGMSHIITTNIEHKSVLEPLNFLARKGFRVTYLPSNSDGTILFDDFVNAFTNDTFLVSVMHSNNETGIIQPIDQICDFLKDRPNTFFHVDAAQTFGKLIKTLQNSRIDLISGSSHKIYGPKGVGFLVSRRRDMKRVPLKPLLFGGGQEKGLRPGTLPVSLIAGLGLCAELAEKNVDSRNKINQEIKESIIHLFDDFDIKINGDQSICLPNVINISLIGIDSEAVMVAIKNIACISNGSACTSSSYTPSHVLTAMGLSDDLIGNALRLSWCHMTKINDSFYQIPKLIRNLT